MFKLIFFFFVVVFCFFFHIILCINFPFSAFSAHFNCAFYLFQNVYIKEEEERKKIELSAQKTGKMGVMKGEGNVQQQRTKEWTFRNQTHIHTHENWKFIILLSLSLTLLLYLSISLLRHKFYISSFIINKKKKRKFLIKKK